MYRIRFFFSENTLPLSNLLFRVNEVNDNNNKWRPLLFIPMCLFIVTRRHDKSLFRVWFLYYSVIKKYSVFVCLFFVVKNYVKKKSSIQFISRNLLISDEMNFFFNIASSLLPLYYLLILAQLYLYTNMSWISFHYLKKK